MTGTSESYEAVSVLGTLPSPTELQNSRMLVPVRIIHEQKLPAILTADDVPG